MLDTHGRKIYQRAVCRLAGGLLKLGLSPNQVTALAFVLGLGSGRIAVRRAGLVGGGRPLAVRAAGRGGRGNGPPVREK